MSKISRITVRAGRCVPHPLHAYGHLKADLEIVSDLEDGDDPEQVRRVLQSDIESQIEQHVADLREGIRDLQAATQTRERIKLLEHQLEEKSKELEELKSEFDDRPLLFKRGT